MQVFCQPIQYGSHIIQQSCCRHWLPFNTTPLALYAWQPDYFEADLQTPVDTPPADDAISSQSGSSSSTESDGSSSSGSASGNSSVHCHGSSSMHSHATAGHSTQQSNLPNNARLMTTSPYSDQTAWRALAGPQPVFTFDFNTPDPITAFAPASMQLTFPVSTAGVCNAVAFWFELHLDEHTCLSSSPYRRDLHTADATWKQVRQTPVLVAAPPVLMH